MLGYNGWKAGNIVNLPIFQQTETELNALGRKVQQIEETFENTEQKLKAATDQLVTVQHAGDESER